MVYLHGGYNNTFPKIEAALEGKEAGFPTTLTCSPKTPSASVTKLWCAPSPRPTSRRA